MKTLSNEELQHSIEATARLIQGDNSIRDQILTVHLENLTDEQRKRATDELTLEPMEPVMAGPDKYHMSGGYYGGADAADGRVDFDARVRGQDGPEWVEWGGGECPVPQGHEVDCKFGCGWICPRKKAGFISWQHYNSMANTNVMAYRDWTAWEQSK